MIGTYRETVTLTLDDFRAPGWSRSADATCRFWIDAALRKLPTCEHPAETDVNPSHTQSCRGESSAWRFRFVAATRRSRSACGVRCHIGRCLRRAFMTALVVGTVLTAINQGDAIVAAALTRCCSGKYR